MAVEEEKVGTAIHRKLEDAVTTYCYLDDFCTGNSGQIKERALREEIQDRLDEEVNFNIWNILNKALAATRTDMAPGETKQFYNKYIKPMHIEVDKDGEVFLRLREK